MTKMGYIKYLKQTWNKPSTEVSELMKERQIEWRNQPTTVRISKPTRIDRARALGYKAKKGFVIVRQRLKRGGRQRPDIKGGRRSAHSSQRKVVGKNYQQIAEERANKAYPNCEVLNSYYITKDGKNIWYEIILIDRDSSTVYMSKNTAWARDTKGKVFRGMTSAGKKARGLRKKGIGSEKTRPSKKANKGRH